MPNYCPECGTKLLAEIVTEAEEAPVEVAEEIHDTEVEVARINADKEIQLAKIQRGILESETVVEAVAAEAHAEGIEEGLAAGAEAVDPAPEPVAESAPEPVVVQNVEQPEIPAPPATEHGHHEAPSKKRTGMGLW